MSRINDAMVAATMRGYDRNNLLAFVAAIIGSDEAQRLMEMYRVGTSKYWQGATVFWQISADGNIRGGKIMLYDRLTGHCVQEPFPHINWVHSVLRLPDFKLTQCFFGEHLLPYIAGCLNTPHGILEQMMQRNPALRQLVDALQLELVGIEKYKPSEISQKSE